MTSDDAAVPPALHYGGLRHDYACGGYTYYYSRPRMAATGTLTLDGTALEVSGTMWFDRQFGDLNAVVHRGWQWFAIEHGRRLAASCCLTSSTCRRDVRRGDAGRARTAPCPAPISRSRSSITGPARTPGSSTPPCWQVTVDGAVYVVTPMRRGPGVPRAAAV